MNFRLVDDNTVGISLDETTTEKDTAWIFCAVFSRGKSPAFSSTILSGRRFTIRHSNT